MNEKQQNTLKSSIGEETLDALKEHIDNTIESHLASAKHTLANVKDGAVENFEKAKQKTGQVVKEHPCKALGTAVAAGLAVGWLMRGQ